MSVIRPPDYEDRVLFLGSNGTGKSQLASHMLAAGWPRWYVIDWKGDFQPLVDCRLVDKPPWVAPRDWRAPRIWYRPNVSEFKSGRSINAVLRWIVDRAQAEYSPRKHRPGPGRIVYIDETLVLANSGHTSALTDIAIAGRALKLGLWVASQRPRKIPVEVRSESYRWFVFYLQYQEDEREVLAYTKDALTLDELEEGFTQHSFWEIDRVVDSRGRLRVRAIHRPPIAIRHIKERE